MSNRIAIILGLILLAAFLVDHFMFHGQGIVSLGRALIEVIHWLRFWN